MTISFPWMLSAVGLGLAYAALPGAVNAEALRRGFSGGSRRSLLVHTGALIGAAAWAMLALTGTSLLARHRNATIVLGLLGALFLLHLMRIAIQGFRSSSCVDGAAPTGGDFSAGIVVSLANPAGLPFWTGLAGGVIAGEGSGADGSAGTFLIGVLIGSYIWGCSLSLLVGWGRRYLSDGFFRGINLVCAIAFAYFAGQMLWNTWRLIGR